MCSCYPPIRKFIVFTAALAVIAVLPPVAAKCNDSALKVEIVSPREGETVYGTIRIEARVNHPEQVDFVDFYIQEPGTNDRYSWKEYSPPYVWVGKGHAFDTTLFVDGKASVVAFVYSGGRRKPVMEKRVHFVIDNGKPNVRILSPPDQSTVGRTVQVLVAASDKKSRISRPAIRDVTLYLDGSPFRTLREGPYTFSVDCCLLPPGIHSLRAVAVDMDGFIAENWITVKLEPESSSLSIPVK